MCALDIRPALETERLVLRGSAAASFAIEHRQFGVIGRLGFQPGEGRRTELACWVERPFRGRGYATEALNAALVWAHEDWGKGALWAGHCADNAAAASVLVKAGFLYTGDVERRPCAARGGEPAPTRMMVWLA